MTRVWSGILLLETGESESFPENVRVLPADNDSHVMWYVVDVRTVRGGKACCVFALILGSLHTTECGIFGE